MMINHACKHVTLIYNITIFGPRKTFFHIETLSLPISGGFSFWTSNIDLGSVPSLQTTASPHLQVTEQVHLCEGYSIHPVDTYPQQHMIQCYIHMKYLSLCVRIQHVIHCWIHIHRKYLFSVLCVKITSQFSVNLCYLLDDKLLLK